MIESNRLRTLLKRLEGDPVLPQPVPQPDGISDSEINAFEDRIGIRAPMTSESGSRFPTAHLSARCQSMVYTPASISAEHGKEFCGFTRIAARKEVDSDR